MKRTTWFALGLLLILSSLSPICRSRSPGHVCPHMSPKYATSFVDGPASLAKLDTLTQSWANTLDSNDILYYVVLGHGGWEDGHSYVRAYDGQKLTDSIMALDFNRINCYKLIVFNPCRTWGRGNCPDSCGFATWLGYKAPRTVSHKSVLMSAAGPQPAWSPGPCDDRPYQGARAIPGLENEWYGGQRYAHCEFLFHFLTALNGGAEPSGYYSHHGPPGFFFDSMDVLFGNGDSRISVAEAFRWARHRDSRLDEDNQMLDLGGLANRFELWPRIALMDSLDAAPLTLVTDSADSGDSVTQVVIKNYGIAAATFPIRLQLGSDLDTSVTVTIGPNHTDTISFPAWLANQPIGSWVTVRCSTELTGDEKPTDDLLLDSIYVDSSEGLGEAQPVPLRSNPGNSLWFRQSRRD